MSQNRSHAVMQQRTEPNDSLDDFPTPPWAVRAVCEVAGIGGHTVWEPACNRGYMVRGLKDYFVQVEASDVHQYGGHRLQDFLFPTDDDPAVDWIITNPPFRLAQQFVERALRCKAGGVAFIVRSAWLEGVTRFENLFSKFRPSHVLQHVERVPMVKGRCDPEASTATSYSWVVWKGTTNAPRTDFDWVPPCRKRLEREGDYA